MSVRREKIDEVSEWFRSRRETDLLRLEISFIEGKVDFHNRAYDVTNGKRGKEFDVFFQ